MTELEKIAYAKSFLDKLSVGIDPTNGSPIPEGDILNNPRLVKCLQYVSELLSKMIDKPAFVEEMQKVPGWEVTPEVLARIRCSEYPISITAFARKVNEALMSSRKFTAANINVWLVRNGYLTRVFIKDNRSIKRPTPRGVEIGIITDDFVEYNGIVKYSVKCNTSAQLFMCDHLSEIIAFSQNKTACRETNDTVTSFSITYDELCKFKYSETPILISQLTENINALKAESSSEKLKPTDITEWLFNDGFLEISEVNGKNYKLPTRTGIEIGISTEQRRSKDGGVYSVALYNLNAQKFIIDNIGAVAKII